MNDSQGSTRLRIRNEVWRQFRDAGYAATTYASVAKACGVGRSLVQYHFPKKGELPVSLVSWVLARSAEAISPNLVPGAGDYVTFHRIGTCTFTFLLERGFSRFILEVLESRAITERLLAMHVEWTVEHLGDSRHRGADVTRTIITVMGGFYDYMYHCLASGQRFDITGCLAASAYASALALSPEAGLTLRDFDLDEAAQSAVGEAVERLSALFEQTI